MDRLRWGIIGCGDVTEVKSGPALQKAKRSELVAVMRRDSAKAQDYAHRHGVPRWYSDVEHLLADEQVNAVYIATPPSSHAMLTVQAAKAGKAVLVEKPMALSTQECQAMVEACHGADVPLAVAYYRRALPRFEKMRELIQGGAIGAPRAVVIRHFRCQGALPPQNWKVDPAVNGGGIFVDVQSHTLDWIDHVFGPASNAFGLSANQGKHYAAEDTVSFGFELQHGVLGSGMCAYSAGRDEETVTVYGTAGEISMSFFAPAPLTLTAADGVQRFDLPDPPHVHQPLIEAVARAWLDGAQAPSTGESAMRTNAVLEQIFAARVA